ncbi:MAG: hypothetical protein ACQESC_04480, partial [Nanobdellota archaeon]
MQAESLLSIDDVEISVDGDDESVSSGEEIDVEYNSEVELTVTLENLYSNSADIELEDAYFEVYDNGDWDIDEESSDIDIDADDSEDLEVTFTIPFDIDDDEVDIVIKSYAEDEDYGFEHTAEFNFEMSLDVPSHEIRIDSASFSSNPASCMQGFVDLNIEMLNTGENDEDEVTLNVVSDSSNLDWHERIFDIEIEEGEEETRTFSIPLDGISDGTYYLDIETYYDTDDLSDTEVAILQVDCPDSAQSSEDNSSSESENTGVVVDTGSDTSGVQGSGVYSQDAGSSTSFGEIRSSTGYTILLIVLILGILAVIGYFISEYMSSRKDNKE